MLNQEVIYLCSIWPGLTEEKPHRDSKYLVNFITGGLRSESWNISVIALVWMSAKWLKNNKCSDCLTNAKLTWDSVGANMGSDQIVTLVQGLLRAVDEAPIEPLRCTE